VTPDLETAVLRLTQWLDTERIPYMLIGGFAVLVWGEPRLTRDVDCTIWVESERFETTVETIVKAFQSRVGKPVEFTTSTRVLPIVIAGVPTDVIFAALPYERDAIERARPIAIGSQSVAVCAPEDLIIHKIISTRQRDREDVESVFKKQHSQMDFAYLDARVEELAIALADSTFLDWYRRLRARHS